MTPLDLKHLSSEEPEEPIYIINKKDAIDEAIGLFINSHPQKKTLFELIKKESCGIYKMGAKRVSVKLEKGNTLLVRVGGGYTKIQDYVDILMNTDSQRIECKNIFGENKIYKKEYYKTNLNLTQPII